MALDPSIPLSVNQPKSPDLVGQTMNAYTLKSAMLQSRQAEQQMADQQALRSVFQDPNSFDVDPSSGVPIPKPETMQKLYSISPTAAQKLGEATQKMRATQQEQQKRSLEMRQAYVNQAGPALASLATEYEQLAAKGDKDAAWAAVAPKVEAANQQFEPLAKQAGVQFQPIRDADHLLQGASQWSKYAEQKLKSSEPMTPYQRATLDKPQSAEGKIKADVSSGKLTPEEGKKALEKKDRIAVNVFTPGQMATQADAEPVSTLKKYGYSEDAATLVANDRLFNGRYPRGMGASVQPRNAAIDNYAAMLAKRAGIDMATAATLPAAKKAEASALIKQTGKVVALEGQVESFHNNLDTWEQIASGIAPTMAGKLPPDVKERFQKITFTPSMTANDMKMAIQRQFNDPSVVSYLTATMTAAMDFARIMQGPQSSASLTVFAMEHAMKMIPAGLDEASRSTLRATLSADANGQLSGQQKSIDRLRKNLGVANPGQYEAPSNKPEAPGTPPNKAVPDSPAAGGKHWVFDPASGTLKPQ